jgi:hypothetical protein
MADEPTYEYIRGKGWVPTTVPTITWEQHGFRVTVMARKPQLHEKWYAEPKDRNLEETVRRLKQFYNVFSYTENMGNKFSDGGWTPSMLDKDVYNWVTVEVVKL